MGRHLTFDEDEIIEKALILFWEKGLQNTSAKDLVKATGITNGSLFHLFKDKQSLYLICLQHYYKTYMGRLEEIMLSDRPFPNKMETILQYIVRKNNKSDRKFTGCFHFNTKLDRDVQDKSILALAATIDNKIEYLFVSMIDQAIKQKELPQKTDSTALSLYFLTMILGLRTYLRSTPPQSKVEQLLKAIKSTIC